MNYAHDLINKHLVQFVSVCNEKITNTYFNGSDRMDSVNLKLMNNGEVRSAGIRAEYGSESQNDFWNRFSRQYPKSDSNCI